MSVSHSDEEGHRGLVVDAASSNTEGSQAEDSPDAAGCSDRAGDGGAGEDSASRGPVGRRSSGSVAYERDETPRVPTSVCGSLLTTGDMARLSNSTLRTVRFYEEEGLICPRVRTSGGHRKFDLRELKKLQMIVDLREAGWSVDEIRSLMALKHRCATPECASREMTAALEQRIADLHRKIEVLQRVRRELTSTIELLDGCRDCTDARFSSGCTGCDVLDDADLPKAAHLLWNA